MSDSHWNAIFRDLSADNDDDDLSPAELNKAATRSQYPGGDDHDYDDMTPDDDGEPSMDDVTGDDEEEQPRRPVRSEAARGRTVPDTPREVPQDHNSEAYRQYIGQLQQQLAMHQQKEQQVQQALERDFRKRDPDWAARQDLEALRQRAEQQDLQQQQAMQRHQQQAAVQQITTGLGEGEKAARETWVDYDDAVERLQESRLSELQSLGLNDQQAKAAVQQDILVLTARALQNGQDPAQTFYDIAKARGLASGKRPPKKATTPEELDEGDNESFDELFEKLWGRT